MILSFIVLLQVPAQPQPLAPRREITDPGTIATNQRITPAGVQSVFTDRVFGVRFGRPGEVWVSIHGAAYRLGWRDNAMLGSAAFDGRAGVQGIAIDPVTRRTLVTSVGLLPADLALSRIPGSQQLAQTKVVAQLTAYDGDSVVPRWTSPALGDDIVGSPAVARRANASGHRVVVVPLSANDALAILDADSGSLLKTVPLGVLPVAAVVNTDGSVAYVTNLGGPNPRDRALPRDPHRARSDSGRAVPCRHHAVRDAGWGECRGRLRAAGRPTQGTRANGLVSDEHRRECRRPHDRGWLVVRCGLWHCTQSERPLHWAVRPLLSWLRECDCRAV